MTLASFRLDAVENPWPWLALLLAGGAVLVVTYRGMARRARRLLPWALLGLRGVGLLAPVLALAKPTWTDEAVTTDPGRVAIVLDTSLSMSLPDDAGRPRYDRARAAVARLRQDLATGAGPAVAVDLFDLAGNPLPDGPPSQPTLDRTDLAQALAATGKQLRSRLVTAVVLISDGMDNTGRQDFRDLADAALPIYAVGFRAGAADRLDLAVRKVQAPERVLVRNAVPVEVLVTKTGGPATEATVTVRRGKEPLASQKVAFGPGAGEQAVTLTFTPTQPGTFVFTAGVEGAAGEAVLANNYQHFPLRVDAEPIRVLYLEGFLRYEYKYLKARLEDDPDVQLTAVVRRVAPEAAPARGALLTAERLKNVDVVFLGDMEASYLQGAEYAALLKWLEEKDKALVVLGGYRSFGPDGWRGTPLADALPVVFADREPYQSEEPFGLELTEEGKRHPLFSLTGDRVQDAAAWAAAPQLLGTALVARAKPAAEVLAINPNVRVAGRPAVVVAVQRYGGGRTLALTADSTWRWSRLPRVVGQADTLFSRFWGQGLRWLAGRQLDQERPLLAVSTDKPAYAAGKPVTITATRQPRPDADLSKAAIAAEVTGPGGKPVAVPLHNSSAAPDVFTGTLATAQGGRYQAAVKLTAGGQVLANQVVEFLVQGADLELADPGTNPAALQALAAATGGQYFDVGDADKVAAQVPRRERRTVRIERADYWNSPWLFAVFIGAVTAEWVLRRRHQLV